MNIFPKCGSSAQQQIGKRFQGKLTSCTFLVPGVPQGLNPPEKLGKLRQIIDRMLKKMDHICQFSSWEAAWISEVQMKHMQ
jgi:hypothetical protein